MKRRRAKEHYWKSIDKVRALARYANNRLKPYYCPLQQRNNHGVFAVHMTARVGFFAQLNWCLYIYAHCERFKLKPSVFLDSPFYTRSQGENWIEYYFDELQLTDADRALIHSGKVRYSYVSSIEQMGLPGDYGKKMTLEHANFLLRKYLRVKRDIQDHVAAFADENFAGRTVLGVHCRGTDKKSEAEPVSYEYVARAVRNYLDANEQVDTLFVASDEEAFIEWMSAEFRHVNVTFHDDVERSRTGDAIHTHVRRGDNYIKGKEALVNSLLLSRCDALIRTASFLSAWSSVFNPSLPVIMLNRPYGDKLWFPDAVIVDKSLSEYLPGQENRGQTTI